MRRAQLESAQTLSNVRLSLHNATLTDCMSGPRFPSMGFGYSVTDEKASWLAPSRAGDKRDPDTPPLLSNETPS